MLGWAVMIFHTLQASALNINWHSVSCSSHFLPRGTDLISYCYTFLISKRFSYLLSQYLKWRHWMATAKLDPVHTVIKLHKICSIKIITRKTKNFQAAWNIIMNFTTSNMTTTNKTSWSSGYQFSFVFRGATFRSQPGDKLLWLMCPHNFLSIPLHGK